MSVRYIIVDQDGEKIHTDSEREARIAFRSGGIVTIIHETTLYVSDDTCVRTIVYVDMRE